MLLVEQPLIQAPAKDYVRQTQERLICEPILQQLQSEVGRDLTERRLAALLEGWRGLPSDKQAYGPGNVVNMLRVLRGDLRALNLSQLLRHGVSVQGIQMQDASLAGALIRDWMFTQAFDASWAVAISRDGQYWAAASKRGEVRVWRDAGQTLQWIWQAHADIVPAIALSPDGRILASGSYDGSIKLWRLDGDTLLWTGWHADSIYTVAFAPDGSVVASGGNDATVRLWDVRAGTLIQTLTLPDPIYTLSWSPDGQWLATGGLAGEVRLWQIQATHPVTYAQSLLGAFQLDHWTGVCSGRQRPSQRES